MTTKVLPKILFWTVIAILTVGFGLNSTNFTDAQPTARGEYSGNEHWNFVSTSIDPLEPTQDDFITFTLKVANDANITMAKIFLCENNICGMPNEMKSDDPNIFYYRHGETFAKGLKVNYKFQIIYNNESGSEFVPASSATEGTSIIIGSLYFEFFIGENWNFKAAYTEPAEPTDEDEITFALEVNDDTKITNVMIKIIWDKPELTDYFAAQLMERSAENKYSYKLTQTFDKDTKVGYQFYIEYDDDTSEPMPTSDSTTSVYTEQDSLFFSVTVKESGIPTVNGDGPDKNDDDEGGFLPGFAASTTIISFILIVIIIIGLSTVISFERKRRN